MPGRVERHRGARQGGHAHPCAEEHHHRPMSRASSDSEADRAIAAKGDAHYVADGGNKDTAVMPCGQVVGLVNEVVPVQDLLFNYGERRPVHCGIA
ncbi:MAG: hypothetical protein MZV70_39115 [Desulfobacterales bacterium]|nr:hypothetical protein [Desulfobacterales bacterium]